MSGTPPAGPGRSRSNDGEPPGANAALPAATDADEPRGGTDQQPEGPATGSGTSAASAAAGIPGEAGAVEKAEWVSRDRDPSGRARNARPRDALGRPLPRGAEGVPTVPDDLQLDADTALAMAQDYLDRALPFQAHEVLETMWKQAEPSERDLWKGLAQIAVGITHIRRANHIGGARLLRRGTRRLEAYAGTTPHGIDVEGLSGTVAEAVARLEQGRNAEPVVRLRSGM